MTKPLQKIGINYIMSSQKKHKTSVIVDVERMKHPFTGLYYYCLNLALNLEKYHSDEFDFYFFAYPGVEFPKHLKRILRTHIDKYYLRKNKKYRLWHTTWQDTKYIPRGDIKFVYTIHDLNFLYTDKPERRKKEILQAVQQKIDRAAAITVISEFVKQDVEKNLDTRGKKITVIYNGVEVEEYPDFDEPSYKPGSPFLFAIGTVLYKKHFHILPALLVGNDYELIISGIHPDKSYIRDIRTEADKYGVSERVRLTGPVSPEEKYWYMKHCEAFLFPSISEGFGLPPIEAMRMGKPVFLSTYTSLPEIGGEHAYYFRDFEPGNMRQVLEEGLKDYLENNRKEDIIRWSMRYTWKNAVEQYVRVYKEALGWKPVAEEHKITAIIPTLNEEKNIADAIGSVSFADEIIVIDSHSTDDTVKIARVQGAKVIVREFDNFSNQKNYAIEQASHDWIFILDADERPEKQLIDEIKQSKETGFEYNCYWVKRINYFMGHQVKFSSWQNDKVVRLFNRKYAKYNGKFVHEEVECSMEKGFFKHKLLHYPYDSFASYEQKMSRYAQLKAREYLNEGLRPNVFHYYLKPAYRFFYNYILRLGILDGKTGYYIAIGSAKGIAMRYRYLREMYNENSDA